MEMTIYLPLIILVILLIFGVPIGIALAGAGMLGIWIITGDFGTVFGILGTTPFSTVAQFTFTTIPTFILMAYLSSATGLAEDLYDTASDWLSDIRGGLAIATVFACAIFGAMSGASVAAASVMGKVAMPNMRRFGYSETLAAGAIGVGATLDILIPPSVAMVIYGIMTETSIGKLLIAGVIPGIVLGILLCLVIVAWVTVRPSDAPKLMRAPWSKRLRGLVRIWPTVLLIVIVLALLYTGIVTPTEVGAIGACLSAIIGLFMGRLTWDGTIDALKATVRTTAMIFVILIGASIFGYYMVFSKVPHRLVTAIIEMNLNRWAVIALIVAGYFIISMFMDELPLLIITIQLTFPIITSLNFDPVWFGVLTMLMMAMGLVFPPVGMIAFIVSATTNVDLIKVYKGTSILIIAIVLTTILMIVFPEIALWLPSRMR
jgi:C4-dicarboxylate transporter, DctM subunit